MSDFLQWLSSNSISANAFLVVLILVALSLTGVYLGAFFQGREISFWPPKIGSKPEPTNTISKKDEQGKTQNTSFIMRFKNTEIEIPTNLLDDIIRISISGLYR